MVLNYELDHLKKLTDNLEHLETENERINNTLRVMIDTIPLMIWMKNADEEYLWANKLVCDKLLHTNTQEVIGKNDSFFEDREKLLSPGNDKWHSFGRSCHISDQQVLNTKAPYHTIEYGYLRGKLIQLEVWKSPVFDADNSDKIIGIAGAGKFITDDIENAEEDLIAE